ncbi:hypothetical protein BLA18112_00257 [Burkholderia lata]|uniref:Uncharacterized protein n=1 Tax=Burkholderia lata (strain ATCC 17760 / DSM 23089 / LMG 22485 / NCIMB 9086 / R18194 / 383) TaxID=482957 RepID=A0A6P2TCG7_BURL3|nr:hypothetical protein [Burkholderia lata]VWC55822.1 hypothetical protein BLA18112_00257 [Burkholderia lata]
MAMPLPENRAGGMAWRLRSDPPPVIQGGGANCLRAREDHRHQCGIQRARNSNGSRPQVRIDRTFLRVGRTIRTMSGTSTIDAALFTHGNSQVP